MIFNMRTVQSLSIGVSMAFATSSAVHSRTIPSADKTLLAIKQNIRRLEDSGAAGSTPTTCTDIPDGYEAFDVAAEDAYLSRNEAEDCHTMEATEDTYQDPIKDVLPSVGETTRLELCMSNDQSTRYIFSNGLPDHPILSLVERPTTCIVPYAVAIPTNPVYDASYLEEVPIAGPMGFLVRNGLPIVDAAWPMKEEFLLQETAWGGELRTLASILCAKC
jgi:hypothetical protein